MADLNDEDKIGKLKNSEIAVHVEEALNDVIVVSFRHQGRVYQGALLDSTKKGLPCGITAPKDFMKPPPPPPVISVEVSEVASTNGLVHRHTYFQETGEQRIPFNFRSLKSQGNKQRQPNKKLTVRLRPRKVLCSKCKSTCNPATDSNPSTKTASNSSSSNSQVPTRVTRRNLRNIEEEPRTVTFKEPEFVLLNESRPDNDSCSNSSTEDVKKPEDIKIVGNYWISPTRESEEDAKDPLAIDESDKMVLRKKRSVGSMEDLWDESIFEEGSKRTKLDPLDPTRTTTPIIKISFGSEGQGTVLKIPAKVQSVENVENSENESERAVKKALKKAKKKRLLGSPNSSPTWGEPRKHKHKHLKKHKKSRHREGPEDQWNVSQTDEEIKEQCLKQRLSISLKRLNATAYMRCDQDDPTPSSSNSPSPDGSEEVPDFPETDLVPAEEVAAAPEVRISSQTVQSYFTADGRKMNQGDVVWGKIHGFPWWPGKVMSISITRKEDGVCLSSHAHVSWYGSPTSSWMLCDQLNPFLETFKVRYNKKKRGPYKEAIRQATSEAQQLATIAVPSASPSQILSVASSPREVNVLS